MAELIANVLAAADGAITTLASSIASTGTTTITTNAAAPAGLQDGEFRIRIDNELLLVTAGQDGTSWTVQRGVEGTTAATHASGTKVRHVLTAELGGVVGYVDAQVADEASSRNNQISTLNGALQDEIDERAALDTRVGSLESAQSGSVPDGGSTGQVLAKVSDDDGDAEWTTAPAPSLLAAALTHDGENWVDSNGDVHDTRPGGYALVIWEGPDPGGLAVDADLWILTS